MNSDPLKSSRRSARAAFLNFGSRAVPNRTKGPAVQACMRARCYGTVVGLAAVIAVAAAPLALAQVIPPTQVEQVAPPSPAPGISSDQRRQALELARRAAAERWPQSKVICGMTIIPADPNVDPKFVKPVPDQATKFTLRQATPAICR